MTPTPPSPLRGILLKCLSVLIFTMMASIVKATSEGGLGVPPGQQVFFRSLFAIPVILVWLAWRHELRTGLRTFRPMGQFYRGILGTGAMGLGFWALSLLPFPEVTAIGYAAPLLTVIFAGMFLGEDVRLFRMSMVFLGLLGVIIVLSPRLGAGSQMDLRESLGAVVTLAAASCTALAQIFVRKLVQQERTSAIVFWFSVTSTLLGLLTLPFGWVMPDKTTLALLIGWFVFGEAPTLVMLIGAALVISAGILIIWREHALGLERNRQRKAMTPQGEAARP